MIHLLLSMNCLKKREKLSTKFKVNEYITLRLEGNKTIIYIKGEQFQQCKFLNLDIKVEEVSFINDIESVDESIDKFKQFSNNKNNIPNSAISSNSGVA